MKEITKLKIQSYDDRRKLVGILADSGYVVKIITEKDWDKRLPDYFVVIYEDNKDEE